MAKKSKIVNNQKKIATVKKYALRRAELKELIRSPKTSDESREEALLQMQKLPKNASPSRVRNRCALTGRARGYYKKFGLGRMKLRDLALKGDLPGVTKASW